MCQVFILTNASKVKDVIKTANVISEELQKTQRDGFGYAVVGKHGVFGERTTASSFASRLGREHLAVNLPIIDRVCNSFGQLAKPVGAALFHGRTSTNHKTLINTHPINKHDWTLIHNGVVNNHGAEYEAITSNDTEHIIEHLATGGIKAVEENISGYYAVGAIDPEGRLHLFKDDTAKLVCAYNKTLDCLVFATTETLLTNVARRLKWTIGPVDKVTDNIYLVFDRDGNLISHAPIEPMGYTVQESRYASLSLGTELAVVRDYDSEQLFLDEVKYADASYTVFDKYEKPMDVEQFLRLTDAEKLECEVYRADGTLIDQIDYFSDDKIA